MMAEYFRRLKAHLFSVRILITGCLIGFAASTSGCLTSESQKETNRTVLKQIMTRDPESRKVYLLMFKRFPELERIMEANVPDPASAKTTDLWWLCQCYAELKKYSKLFPCLNQMEQKLSQGDTQWYWAGTIPWHDASYYPAFWRAQALAELKDYDRAIAQAELALRLAEASNEEPKFYVFYKFATQAPIVKMKAMGLLGTIYAEQGSRNKAQEIAQNLEKYEYDLSFENPSSADERRAAKAAQLAKVYVALGEFERAYTASQHEVSWGMAWSQTVLAGAGEAGEEVTVWRIPLDYVRYKSAYETKRTAEARQGYDELLKHPRIKSFGELYWLILFDRGRIEEDAGSRNGAILYYTQAVEVIETQRSTINTEVNKIGFVGDKQQVYHRLVAALLAEGQAAQAFEYVERAKARALVDLLASKKDFAVASGNGQQIASLVKELDAADLEAVAVKDTGSPKDVTTTPAGGTARTARGVQIKEQLKRTAPELAALVTVTQTGTSEIQALLRPGEVLLEYYYEGDDLAVFVLDRTQIRGIKLAGAGLGTDIAEFRKALEETKSDRYRVISNKLYDRLIAPVGSYMTGKQVLIVPHGALHYLPFSALCSTKDCLIDRASLRLLPSASVLPFLKGRKQQEGGALLALGNPDLGDPKYDLKFAQEEAIAIAKTFPQSKLLLRKQASKVALKTLGPQYTYLHFATHGKFDPDAPMKSGLLLAKEAQEDGFLSLGELYSLRLNADLVTLSACETGLGKVSNGDDVVGLTRGFLYAGSSSIVASLWEVDDLATSTLMTAFYANLKKTDKQESLRQAQLTTRQKYPHPYYWAAFQLTGMP